MVFGVFVQKYFSEDGGKLEVARLHQAHYKWRNTMRKVNLTMSDLNKHRVFCTDFGATLDLIGAEKKIISQ